MVRWFIVLMLKFRVKMRLFFLIFKVVKFKLMWGGVSCFFIYIRKVLMIKFCIICVVIIGLLLKKVDNFVVLIFIVE